MCRTGPRRRARMSCAQYICRLFLGTILGLHLGCTVIQAQTATSPSITSVEAIVGDLVAKETPTADEKERRTVAKSLVEALRSAEQSAKEQQELEARRGGINETLKKVQEELANPTEAKVPPDAEENLETFVAGQQAIDAALGEATKERDRLAAEATRRAERRKQLPQQLTVTKAALKQARSATVTDEGELSAELTKLRGQLRQAEIGKLEMEVKLLESETAYYTEDSELLSAQRELAEARVTSLTAQAKVWQAAVSRARTQDARDARVAARDVAADENLHPYLREVAQGNVTLAERRLGPNGTAEKLSYTDVRLIAIREELAESKKQFQEAKYRIELINSARLDVGETTGSLLLGIRGGLSSIRALRQELEEAIKGSATLYLESEVADRQLRAETGNLDSAVDAGVVTAGLQQAIASEALATFRTQLRQLLEDRREFLATLKNEKETLMSKLTETTVGLQALIAVVGEFNQFIDENILWIRTLPRLGSRKIGAGLPNADNLTARERWIGAASELWQNVRSSLPHWLDVLRHLGQDITGRLALWGLFIAILFLLLKQGSRLKRLLKKGGETAKSRNCTKFGVTIESLLATVMLAIPLWIGIMFLAWRLEAAGEPSLANSLGQAFRLCAGYALFFGVVHHLLRPEGLAECHFGLSKVTGQSLRQLLRWFAPTYIGLVFLVQFTRHAGTNALIDSRYLYLVQMLVLGVFICKAVQIVTSHRTLGGKFCRVLIYAVLIALPLGLALASVLGYQYAVIELERRLRITAWFALGALLVFSMVKRGVTLARRRLKQAQAREQRALRKAEQERLDQQVDPNVSQSVPETPVLDIDAAQQQSDRLIRAFAIVAVAIGLWAVWSDMLPALKAFDKVPLWPGTEAPTVEINPSPTIGLAPDVNQSPSVAPDTTSRQPVSVADLALALFAFFLTYVAVRNIPGLLEVAVLQHMNLKPGSSYAITNTVRYVIVVIGLIVAFGFIEISWSKIQWLAAAITVGIGFGLQEIFANFVAGLILLYERPMRVGDIVKVGTTTGKVTQIHMRATTITAFDNRELVVPNKAFITGDFINWTLTDSVLRVEVPVGVAYGSDVHLVKATLERVGQEHPLTLDEPKPAVIFNAFGNSTLDFELRVHVGTVDDLLPVRNDLHFAINDAFAEAGIEIAFPQLDVHLKAESDVLPSDKSEGPSPGKS